MKKCLLAICFCVLLTACGKEDETITTSLSFNSASSDMENYAFYDGDICQETSEYGISTKDKDFINKLEGGTFYIQHGQYFYPVVDNVNATFFDEHMDIENPASYYDKIFFSSSWEHNIPTLFTGDKIYFFAKSKMLHYIQWYRLKDCGYTVGINNIQDDIAGNLYLDITDDNTFLNNSGLEDLYNQKQTDIIMLDKIAGIKATSDFIDKGNFVGFEKDKDYDFEFYLGTQFKHIITPAKFHLFRGFEKFASINYTTLQDYLYEIEVPSYLTDGYYYINDVGMFRLVTSHVYNEYNTDFNKPLLIIPEFNEEGEENKQVYYAYSEYPPLNRFSTTDPQSVGYTPQTEEDVSYEQQNGENDILIFKEAVTKEYDIFLPEGKNCIITVESPTDEKEGIITLYADTEDDLEGIDKQASYNAFEKRYVLEVIGKGQVAHLTIKGFFKGYNIKLKNAQQYRGQDTAAAEDIKNVSENSAGNTETGFLNRILSKLPK